MKKAVVILIVIMTSFSFAQEKKDEKAIKKANNFVHEGNTLLAKKDDFVSAEMAYRKAISNQPTTVAGIYNLGNSYYKSKHYEEALYRQEQVAKIATSKEEKHKAFHNIGNILMENKKCKEAVEAYKNALRNNPTDDETRYNLGLAKICADQQKDEDKEDKNKDEEKKDENKENEDNKDDDKKEGEEEKDDKGKPKDEKDNKGKDGEDQKQPQQPQPQPGKLSPQQIKNLLEAMNNQEQKVQEKINADKQKGVKVKTDKDW
jgi:tetratricopeptide (TPR) repeat protein